MNETEHKILAYIQNNCRGRANAKTFKTLSQLLLIPERELRLSVAELVTYYEQPIASDSQNGYYWLDNQEEFEQAHRELMSRIKKLSMRCKGLRKGYAVQKKEEEVKPYQLEMV